MTLFIGMHVHTEKRKTENGGGDGTISIFYLSKRDIGRPNDGHRVRIFVLRAESFRPTSVLIVVAFREGETAPGKVPSVGAEEGLRCDFMRRGLRTYFIEVTIEGKGSVKLQRIELPLPYWGAKAGSQPIHQLLE